MKQNCLHFRTFLISSILFSIFFITSVKDPSYALTDAEYRQFISESQEYREADKRLNGVWKLLMEKLDETGKAELKKSQRNWIRNERDSNAKLISDERSISLASAYAVVTEQRAKALEQLLEPKEVKSKKADVQEKHSQADTSAPKEAGKPKGQKDKGKGLIFIILGGILLFVAWVCWQKRKQSEGAEYREKAMRDVGGGSIGKQVKAHISAGIYGLIALLIGILGVFLLLGGLNLCG